MFAWCSGFSSRATGRGEGSLGSKKSVRPSQLARLAGSIGRSSALLCAHGNGTMPKPEGPPPFAPRVYLGRAGC